MNPTLQGFIRSLRRAIELNQSVDIGNTRYSPGELRSILANLEAL